MANLVDAWKLLFRPREAVGSAAEVADARVRSLTLLKAHLSEEQRAQYDRHKSFEVIGGDSGGRYRIVEYHQMNVELLDRHGKRLQLFCFRPEGALPIGDMMLAQKLALELFETEALRVANSTLVLEHGSIELARMRRFRF